MDNETRQTQVKLALSQAKRVKRESTILVQQLAELRDNSTAEEAQEQDEHKD